jgi:hypothetical protein
MSKKKRDWRDRGMKPASNAGAWCPSAVFKRVDLNIDRYKYMAALEGCQRNGSTRRFARRGSRSLLADLLCID